MRRSAASDDSRRAEIVLRDIPTLTGWIAIAIALGVAAMLFTSRPEAAIGQTGPALTPPAPSPAPPPSHIVVSVGPFAGNAEHPDHSTTAARVFDVSTLESTPSLRRLPRSTPSAADQFIEMTQGGQPLFGIEVDVGATGRGTLPRSLTRAQLARLCVPLAMQPPGIELDSLVVYPGRLVKAEISRHQACVEFVFTEPGAFVLGTHTIPVVPELADFYASTGGRATWGPCLTEGFYASVSPTGTIIEAPAGSGLYMQICANGVLGYHPELAGTGYEIQPVLATHWIRGENGAYVGPDPPVANSGQGRYFPQTGHNVSGPFLSRFLALGGADVLGYPITESLAAAPGFTDQYFQYLKLRMNDATGEVTIRPIGREFIAMLAANRQTSAGST